MADIINLPTTTQQTTAKLVDINTTKNILIKSLPYIPDFQRDEALFKDASILLDALLMSSSTVEAELQALQQKYNEEGIDKTVEPVDWSVMDEIYSAYCDTLYKLPGYTNLSYEARIALIEENGFDYVLDLLLHMYDSEYAGLEKKYKDGAITSIPNYDDFVKSKSNMALTRLTSLFAIINMLKGTTAGLELVFKILDIPEFLYITWDIVSDFKGPITLTNPDKFIPVAVDSELRSDSITPPWGEKYVTDNNIIWKRTKGDVTLTWEPSTEYHYGDLISIQTDSGESLIYEAYRPEKGDVFTITGESGVVQYIFNGVAWHLCTDYKEFSVQREAFTAILNINGLQNSSDFQAKLDNFVRYYMLPYIDVTLEFRQAGRTVYAFPSGYGILETALLFANYVDEMGNVVHHNLSAKVNERWGVSNPVEAKDLTLGNPVFNDRGFQGSFDLSKSFVQDADGTRHYLYSKQFLTMPDVITGPARNKYNDQGQITDYNGDYLQVPVKSDGYVDLDFDMYTHQNPSWSEDGSTFNRDVIVRIYKALTVYGVDHMSVKKLNQTQIKDFLEIQDEVYGGRSTRVVPTSKSVRFTTKSTWVREKTGIEGPYNLIFSDYETLDTKPTGIGDIGILGSNEYFIYNGMLLKATNTECKYIDGNDNWTDIGATNVNPEYKTPAIQGGNIKYLYNDEVFDMPKSSMDTSSYTEEGNWTHITGFVNKHYTAFGICNGRLYQFKLEEDEICYSLLDDEQGWSYITGAYYYDTYKAYGIKNGVMYMIDTEITPLTYNGEPLVGWDSSFDCISRYHHTNKLFTTYGICNGNLYSINETTVTLLDSNGWTAICGYYNDESPRTFGYGIKNGVLYELKGNEVVLKDDTMFWYDISGCSTSTNTFVLGLAKFYESEKSGYIYIIRDGVCEKLLEDGGWTDVFGRYTTSKSANSNCFGFGIKNKKLYMLHRELDNPITASGNWKLNGEGLPVDLSDYDIEDVYVIVDGKVISGQYEIVKYIPIDENDDLHNYDIIINYETVGFNDNTRYNIKTEHTFSQSIYLNPEEEGEHHRTGISLEHMNGEFNTSTGISNPFINCPIIIHGTRKINGNGEAYDFVNEKTYLELPNMGYYTVTFTYDGRTYGPYRFNKTDENIKFMTDNEFIYNIPQDEPDINSYITRRLNVWDANLERDIEYLLTIRDEYSITVNTVDNPDEPQEVVIQFGCVGVAGDYQPIILDRDFNTGIYFGNEEIVAYDGTTYTKLYDVPVESYLLPFVKFIKTGDKYIVHTSLDGETYTNSNISVNEPKFMGGDGTNFGDCIILLASSYMVGNLERVNLYENGYYISINTQSGPVIEKLTTGDNQEVQKVIEIQTEAGNKVIDLDMDTLYTSMETSCGNPDLTVTDTFTFNKLNVGFHEGIDTATLTYSGNYYLDSEKANEVGNIGNYQITRKASEFNADNYLNINPENEDPLVITTGNNVDEQYLFQSEEDSIFTNKYLLTSEISGTYEGDNEMRLVHSGEEYELLTDKPQTETRVIEYNAERFEIDTSKIQGTDVFTFDDYTAMLQFYNNEQMWQSSVTIPIELLGDSTQPGGVDTLPVLCFNTNDNIKRKTFEFDGQSIEIGNITVTTEVTENWYTMSEQEELELMDVPPTIDEETGSYSYNGKELEYDSYVMIDDVEYNVYKDEQEKSYYLYSTSETIETPDVDPAYTFNENGEELWWKLNIQKTFHGLNKDWVIEHNPEVEPKDKLIYDEGKVHNFSDKNYFEVKEIKDTNGFVFSIVTSDDTSINQGIFDCKGVGSLCIKEDTFRWIDNNGKEYISEIIAEPGDECYFAIRNLKEESMDDDFYVGDHEDGTNRNTINIANIYYSEDGEEWQPLFDLQFRINLTNVQEYTLGYSNIGSEYVPFNGVIDLTKTWTEKVDGETILDSRLFQVTQVTKFYISPDKNDWTLYHTITTPYSVWEYEMGFDFTGTLDMYKSELLLDYTLGWVDNRILIDTKVRQELIDAGVTVLDTDVFDLESYGIQISKEPKRWDRITVTYTTTDNAYYLEPNTKYYIKFRTKVDTESGKCLLEQNGNATWKNGIISNINTTDNYSIQFTKEDYIVLKFKPANITTTQAICGYGVDNSKSIVLENKELKLFDDSNYHTLLTNIKTNKYYWIKLYTTDKPIEISTDGDVWEPTDVSIAFSGYEPFIIGHGYTSAGRVPFLGSIDLKESYISVADEVSYLYIPYKKVMPMISTNGTTYYKLGLVPLLTTEDFISFGIGFDGELDLYESKLLETDNVYWQAKQITVYNDTEEIEKFILDNLSVELPYWTDEEYIRIHPSQLCVNVEGLPEIGDTITLTYNTWYLFRENNTEYNFNVTYDDNYCYVSYNKVGDDKVYTLFTTYKRNYIINTGYQFNGRLSYYESTRFGLPFCDWFLWDTYEINYKEYGTDEWVNWSMFTVDQSVTLFEQCGIDLNGIHYLESSWYKDGSYLTPFISHYDMRYVIPHGSVNIVDGIATVFDIESYLTLIPEMVEKAVRIDIVFTTSEDIGNQGIATNALINRGQIAYTQRLVDAYTEAKPNKTYVLQYLVENGKLVTRVLFTDYISLDSPKESNHVITAIPVDVTKQEGDEGYLITTPEQINKLKLFYRVKDFPNTWDKCTNSGSSQWYPVEFENVESIKYGQTLYTDLYIAKIPIGWNKEENTNPDGLDIRRGDILQIRIKTEGIDRQSYMEILTYTDITYLHRVQV